MRNKIEDKEKQLERKIERVRELLYKKIEEQADKREIQKTSEILDKLIVNYLKK